MAILIALALIFTSLSRPKWQTCIPDRLRVSQAKCCPGRHPRGGRELLRLCQNRKLFLHDYQAKQMPHCSGPGIALQPVRPGFDILTETKRTLQIRRPNISMDIRKMTSRMGAWPLQTTLSFFSIHEGSLVR